VCHWADRNNALYTIERDGSDRRQLVALPAATRFEPRIRGVAWSPDSRRIAYVANDAFLYTIGSNGGAPRLVAAERNPDYTVGNPAWSPNGRWIAYGGHCHVARLGGDIDCSLVARIAPGAKRRVLLNSPGDTTASPPAWTPDSRSLLYSVEARLALFPIEFATAAAPHHASLRSRPHDCARRSKLCVHSPTLRRLYEARRRNNDGSDRGARS
jgi:Tol biopolymer transport system component